MGLASLLSGVCSFLVVLLIWLSSTVYTIKQFYFSGRDENLEIHKYLRNTSMAYLISNCIAYFVVVLLTGLALSSNENFYTETVGYNLLFSLIILFGTIGFMSHYLFLSSQVYYSFKPTQYALSTRTMKLYISSSIFVSILLIIYAIAYFIYRPLLNFALPIAITAVIINFSIAGSLVYAFTRRLTKFASSYRHETKTSDHKLSPRQSSLVSELKYMYMFEQPYIQNIYILRISLNRLCSNRSKTLLIRMYRIIND